MQWPSTVDLPVYWLSTVSANWQHQLYSSMWYVLHKNSRWRRKEAFLCPIGSWRGWNAMSQSWLREWRRWTLSTVSRRGDGWTLARIYISASRPRLLFRMSGPDCFCSFSDRARQDASGTCREPLRRQGALTLHWAVTMNGQSWRPSLTRSWRQPIIRNGRKAGLQLWLRWTRRSKNNTAPYRCVHWLMRRELSRCLLDDIQVNICLLSADKLSALCGSPGQKEPLTTGNLKDKELSVIELEDVFQHDMHDRIQTSGIAGSGKSTAFMQKAPYEWAKVEPSHGHRPFWPHIALFFRGSLTNKNWWKAQDLVEIFGLSRYNLTQQEERDVMRYIKSHSKHVLLVADALDEATVEEDSLLWEILTGKCEDLPRLKLIILSQPCERALWLSKNCLFHRRLEVVGFTDARVELFIHSFFAQFPQRALELQQQLAGRADVSVLMHTPLLATLICRLFQLDMALPSTQTGVYQSAVLAMLRQSCGRSMRKAPKNILDELSPPELQATMENLCKLAYDTLKKTEVVFTETQLSSAGCLSAAADLGFLSSSPGVNIAGHDEDAYSFQHHTMQEFFAAVHVARECNRTTARRTGGVVAALRRKFKKAKPSFVAGLVDELGVDGAYARFWPFVSGLLSGSLCESLLSAIADKVTACDGDPLELSRLLLLLLHCHSECVTELPREGSPAVAMVMRSIGMQLTFIHVSASDARAAANVLRLYSSSVDEVRMFSTMMDDSSASIVITGLQNCTHLTTLNPGMISNAADSQAVAKVIAQNKSSLRGLTVPVGDEELPLIAPSITACRQLVSLGIGSRALTSKSATVVAETFRCHRSLKRFGLTGGVDDDGFTSIASSLLDTSAQLEMLDLHWTMLSVSMLSDTLTSLTCLTTLQLVGNPIGDDGFHQLITPLLRLTSLQYLQLVDVDLTIQSVEEMDKLLQHTPTRLVEIKVMSRKNTFLSTGQDVDDIAQLISMTLKYKVRRSEPVFILGYPITEQLTFVNDRSQKLVLNFFDWLVSLIKITVIVQCVSLWLFSEAVTCLLTHGNCRDIPGTLYDYSPVSFSVSWTLTSSSLTACPFLSWIVIFLNDFSGHFQFCCLYWYCRYWDI